MEATKAALACEAIMRPLVLHDRPVSPVGEVMQRMREGWKAGNVDYKKVSVLQGLYLSLHRGKAREDVRVTAATAQVRQKN